MPAGTNMQTQSSMDIKLKEKSRQNLRDLELFTKNSDHYLKNFNFDGISPSE